MFMIITSSRPITVYKNYSPYVKQHKPSAVAQMAR